MIVAETFFSIEVRDMRRATAFYVNALGAIVAFESAGWSSLRIAGVRLGLALVPEHSPTKIGVHFAVHDLAVACTDIESAGGHVVGRRIEVAPGVVIADVTDTDGNTFTLTQA